MQLTKNFKLQEFVHPDIFNAHKQRALDGLNPAMIETSQMLREDLDCGIIICNWHLGGPYIDSGLRTPTSEGAPLSMHRFGAATDDKFDGKTTDEVYDHIMSHQRYYANITRIEKIEHTRTKQGVLGRDWMHIEYGYRNGQIKVFSP